MKSAFRYLVLARIESDAIVADTGTGRLIRLEIPDDVAFLNPSYIDLERAERVPEVDPARIELIRAKTVRFPTHPVKSRLLFKLLEEFAASEGLPPLILPGPSVAYTRFDGFTPSCAVIALHKPRIELQGPLAPRIGFQWNEMTHHFPLTDRLADRLTHLSLDPARRKNSKTVLTDPHFAILAFATPREGYCKKWVTELY